MASLLCGWRQHLPTGLARETLLLRMGRGALEGLP